MPRGSTVSHCTRQALRVAAASLPSHHPSRSPYHRIWSYLSILTDVIVQARVYMRKGGTRPRRVLTLMPPPKRHTAGGCPWTGHVPATWAERGCLALTGYHVTSRALQARPWPGTWGHVTPLHGARDRNSKRGIPAQPGSAKLSNGRTRVNSCIFSTYIYYRHTAHSTAAHSPGHSLWEDNGDHQIHRCPVEDGREPHGL